MKDPSCRERWLAQKNNEIKTLRKLWRLYVQRPEARLLALSDFLGRAE